MTPVVRSAIRFTRAGGFAAVAALGALMVGCGSSGSTTTVTEAGPQSTATNADTRPVHRPQANPADAKALVRHFYALLNSRRYASAWKLVPPSVRNEAGGFGNWKAGYRTTLSSQPKHLLLSRSVAIAKRS
jgi:hypothetical protein